MTPTYSLEVGMHAMLHRALFTNKDEAQAELDKLQAELNKDAYGYNKTAAEKRDNSWTINTPTGPMVVMLDKVEMARVIDMTEYNNLAFVVDEELAERELDRKIKERKALMALEAPNVQS